MEGNSSGVLMGVVVRPVERGVGSGGRGDDLRVPGVGVGCSGLGGVAPTGKGDGAPGFVADRPFGGCLWSCWAGASVLAWVACGVWVACSAEEFATLASDRRRVSRDCFDLGGMLSRFSFLPLLTCQ